MTLLYPRDLKGYNGQPPNAKWPNQARIAVQFVLNFEEGAENCTLHGDPESEVFLSELIGAKPFRGRRHLSMESIYEYGSRAGVWRVLELFRSRGNVPLTVFGVAMAMQRSPNVVDAFLEGGHEIACHGYRWINYDGFSEADELEHMEQAIEIHEQLTGKKPSGWYTGRTSEHTRRLVSQHDHFEYDADDYSDDLPFWSRLETDRPHLVVPYTLDANDMRFAMPQGFHTSQQFYEYLQDAFDVLYAEGEVSPKMMSIGLHCRLIGRPGRFKALQRFLDYVLSHEGVWITRRIDIARHWTREHPFEYVT